MSYIRHMIATMAIELENLPKLANFSPLYLQIKGIILEALEAGRWRPGEAIPSELELASQYQVSQGTVRKAIDELAAENVLIRRQGKGTFVATHHEDQAKYRFLRLASDRGVDTVATSRTLVCQSVVAPKQIIEQLNLAKNAKTIYIQRLLSFSGKPIVLEEIWLPADVFAGLTMDVVSNWGGQMYALFESEFGVHMLRASEKLKSIQANSVTSTLLQVDLGFPILSVERVSYTYADKAVEVRQAQYLTLEYHYKNELS